MTGTREDSPNPSRRAVLGAGSALLGANLVSAAAASPASAELAQLSLPAKASQMPPPGYNILFIFVDQEHFFEKWAFPVPGREYLKKNGTSFANHQSASQVCSSARSTVYTGQHIPHTGVFDNMELPWQPNMSTDVVTIGHRLQQVGYHAAYQGKWHLSANLDAAHQPVDASLLKNREILESYGFVDFLGVGDLIDGPLGGYSYAKEPPAEKIKKLVTMQPDWRNRGAIRSIFDGRYRFSRYFSPIDFNRPTTYEDLVAKNDLEVYDHQEDPQETRNLAQDGKAKAELMMALNATLNGRIDEEIGEDDGKFLPIRNGAWYPAAL